LLQAKPFGTQKSSLPSRRGKFVSVMVQHQIPADTPAFLPTRTYLATIDVARRLGLTPNRVRQLRQLGRLRPVCVTVSGIVIYREADVTHYLQTQHRRQAAPVERAGKALYAYRGRFTLGGLFEGTLDVHKCWRARRDLNPRPTGSKPAALSN
jgi:hypothetical protein